MLKRNFYPSWIVLLAFLSSLHLQQEVKAFGPNTNQRKHASLSAGNGTPNSGEKNKEKRNNIDVENTYDVNSFISNGIECDGLKKRSSRRKTSSTGTLSSSFALKCAPADDMSWDPTSAPKLDFDEDFYAVLEVEVTATAKELKKAYYKMVFKYHPDNRKDASEDEKKLCNQQMMVINNAYRILKEGDLRQKYDLQRRRGLYGNKAKMPRGNGGGDTAASRASSSRTRTTERTQRRTSYTTPDDDDIDDMGWSKKNQKRYSSWASRDIDADAQRWAEQEDYEEGMFDDLDEFMNEGWFDEEMKAKLKARRRRQSREQNPTAAARARYGEGEGRGGPQSIFEEIKDLLKEEERSKSSKRETQRKDVEREQKFYARSNGDMSDNPNSPINKLRRELQRLEMKVASDQRDWGEVLDQELIEERLRDLNEIKQLQLRLEELQQEENDSRYYRRDHNDFGDDSFDGGGDHHDEDSDRRPQRQRASSSSSSKYAAGFDDDEGCDAVEEEIEDRLYQRYRRRRAAERGNGRDGDTSVENEIRRLRGL